MESFIAIAQCSKYCAIIFADLCYSNNLLSQPLHKQLLETINNTKDNYLSAIISALPQQLTKLGLDIIRKEDPIWYRVAVLKKTQFREFYDLLNGQPLTRDLLETICDVLMNYSFISYNQKKCVLEQQCVSTAYMILQDILCYKGPFVTRTAQILLNNEDSFKCYTPYTGTLDQDESHVTDDIDNFILIDGDLYIDSDNEDFDDDDSEWDTISEESSDDFEWDTINEESSNDSESDDDKSEWDTIEEDSQSESSGSSDDDDQYNSEWSDESSDDEESEWSENQSDDEHSSEDEEYTRSDEDSD
ncbi:ORF_0430R [Scale drop disease virus]|uniref:ORF_0430R n=1 Tax=Scale drop disease virus TaxID=1697349 RepID=A0A0K1L6S7_9VIRU|nr:ORF_0430R [Scale drop disease virus]AKU37458.1 ORF_0430R [Scale drop disease virus]UNH60741.1 hypothetical protein SDDV_ORF072 [Scale drop disease virus]